MTGRFRKTAFAAGVLYLITFVSIPNLGLYGPVLDPKYMLGTGSDTGVFFGVILDIVVALAGIGTAVVLFPVVKRQNEAIALGFIASRVLEAAMIFAGVMFLLSLVTLRASGIGSGGLVTAHALVALYDQTLLVGQSFMPVVNALLLGSLLFQSRLVPRALPILGFIGAALLVTSDIAKLFEVLGPASTAAVLVAIPIALWEFSLGVWLVVKGFNQSAQVFSDVPTAGARRPLTSAASAQ